MGQEAHPYIRIEESAHLAPILCIMGLHQKLCRYNVPLVRYTCFRKVSSVANFLEFVLTLASLE